MGDFEAMLSGVVESPVKYHSVRMYALTSYAKRERDSVWWVVLVGRYPQLGASQTRTPSGQNKIPRGTFRREAEKKVSYMLETLRIFAYSPIGQ